MEELRIERRHVADVVCLAFKRLAPVDGIYRRDGVAEGKIGIAVLDALNVGDTTAWHDDDVRSHGVGGHILDGAAQGIPGATLGAGHETKLLGIRGSGHSQARADKDGCSE